MLTRVYTCHSTVTIDLLAFHGNLAIHCHLVFPMHRTVDSFDRSSTLITAIAIGCWVLCRIFTCFYFSVFSFVSMYFLLFCLGFVGFSLPLYLGFNFVVKTSVSKDNTSFSLALDSNLTNAFPILTFFVLCWGCR